MNGISAQSGMPQKSLGERENIYFYMSPDQMGDTVWWLHALTRIRQTFPKDEYNILVPCSYITRTGADGKPQAVFAFDRQLYRNPELGIYWVHQDGVIEAPNQEPYPNKKRKPNFLSEKIDEVNFLFAVLDHTNGSNRIPSFEHVKDNTAHVYNYFRPPLMYYADNEAMHINDEIRARQNTSANTEMQNAIHVIDELSEEINQFTRKFLGRELENHRAPLVSKIDTNTELPHEFLFNSDGSQRPLVVMQTGTSVSQAKDVHPDILWNVACVLSEAGCSVVFAGRGSDPDPSEGKPHMPGIISRVGEQNLPGTLRVVVNADLVISADTGIGHVAAAYGVPTLTVFGTASMMERAYPYPNPGRENYVYALRKPQQYDVFNPSAPQSTAPEIATAAMQILTGMQTFAKLCPIENPVRINLLQPALKSVAATSPFATPSI